MSELNHQVLSGKNVVVIGGSKGVGRAIVAAAHAQGARVLSVARKAEPLSKLSDEFPGIATLQLDATEDTAAAKVISTLVPDVLVVCAGATPYMASLGEQTFEQFSRNWNSDVRMAFNFTQAALNKPLAPGTTIILISSGAALNGSPLSGGYAGSKRTQMFIASYAQKEAARKGLGLRFVSLVPGGIMAETELGKAAVGAYAAYGGVSDEKFVQGLVSSPTPGEVAGAVIELATASDPSNNEGKAFAISKNGLKVLP